jgi:NAD(P)H-dependent FMN reductase
MFAASLRKDSLNKKLIRFASKLVSSGNEVSLSEFNEFPLPVYDGDIEAKGIPPEVSALGEKLASADFVVIATPEYNGSVAGPFKNAVDWVSRLRPIPFEKKPCLLLGATPGAMAAIRGLQQSRVPLEVLGAFVYPQSFGLAQAHTAFTDDGILKDEKQKERLEKILKDSLAWAARLA